MDTVTPRPAAGRAAAIAAHGSVCAALDAGAVLARVTLSLAEAVLLGLISQGVRTFVGVLGHGSTALAREIEEYEAVGVVRFVGVRHETEAAHAATALRVATGERAAVVTAIGPGSFLMNPQALVDGVVHGARGMIIVLDNRRMGAISALQEAQYGKAYATYDDATIDYVALASAIDGVTATSGDGGASALVSALDDVYGAGGVGLVHDPVYYGTAPEGSVDSFGRWNVGPWVADAQALRHGIDL